MLRALAGYFFGGPQDEVPQPQVECETKEVNDWLVVNMPDQPEDHIDFEDADDVDETELEDEDDVLWSLSYWLTLEDESTDESTLEECRIVKPADFPPFEFYLDNDSLYQMKDCVQLQLTRDLQGVPFPTHHMDRCWKAAQLKFSKIDGTEGQVTRKDCHDLVKMSCINDARSWLICHSVMDGAELMRQFIYSSKCAARSLKVKEVLQCLKEKNVKSRVIQTPDVTCHPVYSKTYVNHRHPALSPPKTDLLQKIKELEPEQRATQHVLKKHITRGQVNRQNKSYLYDTSTKKNRRKNLQRNPSGANNNRKCY